MDPGLVLKMITLLVWTVFIAIMFRGLCHPLRRRVSRIAAPMRAFVPAIWGREAVVPWWYRPEGNA